jgi:hypothetical protein
MTYMYTIEEFPEIPDWCRLENLEDKNDKDK